ncbi:hypothetical protein KFU94_66370 [Chloroflexi bacterium TSY]|nr:hypothetical protein [Chloroflexi bacterium TSY]
MNDIQLTLYLTNNFGQTLYLFRQKGDALPSPPVPSLMAPGLKYGPIYVQGSKKFNLEIWYETDVLDEQNHPDFPRIGIYIYGVSDSSAPQGRQIFCEPQGGMTLYDMEFERKALRGNRAQVNAIIRAA